MQKHNVSVRVCACALTRKEPRVDCGVNQLFEMMPSAKSWRES